MKLGSRDSVSGFIEVGERERERENTKVFAQPFHVMILICEKIPADGGAMLQEMNQLLLFLYK